MWRVHGPFTPATKELSDRPPSATALTFAHRKSNYNTCRKVAVCSYMHRCCVRARSHWHGAETRLFRLTYQTGRGVLRVPSAVLWFFFWMAENKVIWFLSVLSSAYSTVSGVNGPLVILDNVKVRSILHLICFIINIMVCSDLGKWTGPHPGNVAFCSWLFF